MVGQEDGAVARIGHGRGPFGSALAPALGGGELAAGSKVSPHFGQVTISGAGGAEAWAKAASIDIGGEPFVGRGAGMWGSSYFLAAAARWAREGRTSANTGRRPWATQANGHPKSGTAGHICIQGALRARVSRVHVSLPLGGTP